MAVVTWFMRWPGPHDTVVKLSRLLCQSTHYSGAVSNPGNIRYGYTMMLHKAEHNNESQSWFLGSNLIK